MNRGPKSDADAMTRGVLVVDYGSQTTLLIARRLRERGIYSEVWPCTDPRLAERPACRGLVLSGGPASVRGEGAPGLPPWLAESLRRPDPAPDALPLLGICYGLQLLVEAMGGEVAPAPAAGFGRTRITPVAPRAPLLADLPAEPVVWMSHNDAALALPEGVRATARTAGGVVAALERPGWPLFAVQFHPEVSHTAGGAALLERFAREVCGVEGRWSMADVVADKTAEIAATVGSRRVICGLSGGVDSSVTAALVARAVGRQLVCVLVDNGLLRAGEVEQVRTAFAAADLDLELRVVDARERFLAALRGLSDPEEKRKAIGAAFIEVFEAEARTIEGVGFLAQGTLYPDVIESAGVGGAAAVIKSHHNVGGLPERLPFALLEPLRLLFKDEVRALGRVLGLPEALLERHPFPGPGLAVRVLGEVTEERLALVRAADRIFIEALHEADLYHAAWQAFAVLLPVRTVGVMGDARTYQEVIALRAVTSVDGMTADRAELPLSFLGEVADRIVNQVPGVNRVVYDLSSKPPATIEWE